jgi:hypothetical protein
MEPKRLRPHSSLLRRGIAASFAFFVPVFIVLYYLAAPIGLWPAVVIAQVVIAVVYLYALISYLRLGIWVSELGITERGFFGVSRHFDRASIESIVIMMTFHGGWVDTNPQLFIVDQDGRQVIRMRGQFWTRDAMMEVASTLDVPLTEIDHPVTASELRARYPELLYWFERRPVFAAVLIGVAIALSAALCFVLLTSLGEHLGLI